MSSLQEQEEELRRQIEKLQEDLKAIEQRIRETDLCYGGIVYSRKHSGYKHRVVHIIPSYADVGETVPTLSTYGTIGYNYVEPEPQVIPTSYTDHTVLTREQVKRVFEFIENLAEGRE